MNGPFRSCYLPSNNIWCDKEKLVREGDMRRGGGLRERARTRLRERERCGGPPERDERSLEGVLPRGETSENGGRAISRTASSPAAQAIVSRSIICFQFLPCLLCYALPPPRSDLSERSRSRISSSRCLRLRSVSATVLRSLARRISSFFSPTWVECPPGKPVLQLGSTKGRP